MIDATPLDPIVAIANRLYEHDREAANRSTRDRAQEIIQELAIHGWRVVRKKNPSASPSSPPRSDQTQEPDQDLSVPRP